MSVLVVGSLNVDIVTVTVKGLPKPGETLLGKSKGVFFGGKGANQAVACARLGGDVTMVGAVGLDEDGKLILNALNHEGVNNVHIAQRGNQTGFAAVTVSGSEGENTVSQDRFTSSSWCRLLTAYPLFLRSLLFRGQTHCWSPLTSKEIWFEMPASLCAKMKSPRLLQKKHFQQHGN